MTNLAHARLLAADVTALPAERDGVSTALDSATAELGTFGGIDLGVWEAGPGEDSDVEVDEVFLVLSGRGTVAFADGSVVELRPGVLVRLHAGDRTQWTISERLRKLYLTPTEPQDGPR
jgi:prepilin-type processing-associated H-X9-DG protein